MLSETHVYPLTHAVGPLWCLPPHCSQAPATPLPCVVDVAVEAGVDVVVDGSGALVVDENGVMVVVEVGAAVVSSAEPGRHCENH